jgi:hypothetical protein
MVTIVKKNKEEKKKERNVYIYYTLPEIRRDRKKLFDKKLYHAVEELPTKY